MSQKKVCVNSYNTFVLNPIDCYQNVDMDFFVHDTNQIIQDMKPISTKPK